MRILVDTNVLVSTLLFPKSIPSFALEHIINHHDLFLCQQNIDELNRVIGKIAPELLGNIKEYLESLPFRLLQNGPQSNTKLRDETDQLILDAAIAYHIDIVVTGDMDFLAIGLTKPECMTARQYLEKFGR